VVLADCGSAVKSHSTITVNKIFFFQRQFRKLTNYLLGFICFYDAIYGTAGIVPFVTMTGKWQIPLNVCFFLESPSPFSVTTSIDLMLLLGLERLVSVIFPIWFVYVFMIGLLKHSTASG
jgi:hypothetical protein